MSTLPGFLPFGEDRGQGEAYRAVCFDWVKAQPVAWSWFATLTCARAPTTEEALDLAFIRWARKVERLAFADLPARQRKRRILPWVRAIELSAAEEPHVHALIGCCDHLTKSKLERLWRLGNALVTPIAGLDSALGYTLKALPRGANINFSRSVFPLKG
mgnify:CR=1 FL=1|tara:strand:- start:5160 stop:5636 length:477 start_codon:yes stop_codon:yes gene_type:complete